MVGSGGKLFVTLKKPQFYWGFLNSGAEERTLRRQTRTKFGVAVRLTRAIGDQRLHRYQRTIVSQLLTQEDTLIGSRKPRPKVAKWETPLT